MRRVDFSNNLAGDESKIDRLVRAFVFDRFDARQRHEVLNELLHAAGFPFDDT